MAEKGKKKTRKVEPNGESNGAEAGKRAAFRARTIKLLAQENPKRGASAKRFDKYKDGMTVQEYLDAGGTTSDIRYDEVHKFIELSPE